MIKEKLLSWLSTLPFSGYFENVYVQSAIIIILTVLFAKALLFVFSKYLVAIAAKTKTKLDDLIFEHTKKPLFYLILVFGFKLAIENIGAWTIITNIVNSLLAIVFVYILLRVFDIFIETWGESFAKKTKSNIDDILLPLFHKAAKGVFILIVVMWILAIWEIDITPYLAGVGISGLVLGMALQDSLKNIFGGATLLLDKTFQIGDKIKLESGEVGTVHDVGLRSTKLITFDNEIIYIPNGYLANSKVQNYTRPSPKIRTKVEFGIEYGSDIEDVKKVVLAIFKDLPEVLKDPAPAVLFLEMGDFALSFKATFWVDRWDHAYGAKLDATQKIYNALNKAKIGIPYPTQTVYLQKQ